MKAIYVDDERSAHINFKYDISNRSELSSVEFFYYPLDALEYVKQNHIDCAFLDVQMPAMDGITLSKEILVLHPSCNIVFITNDRRINKRNPNVKYCLPKPYMSEDLFAILEQLAH